MLHGILGKKMAANLKVNKKSFESAISFSLKSLNKFDLKLKIKQQKALEQPIRNQIGMDFTRCVSRPQEQGREPPGKGIRQTKKP